MDPRVADEWIPLSQMTSTKKVRVATLPAASRSALMAELFDQKFDPEPRQGRKGRKTRPQSRLEAVS
jgi:hypothetical protein